MKSLLGFIALAIAIQFVPYGKDHANPPVVKEPRWETSEVRALAKRACFDCHSNETVWPAYAAVAPVSWLVAHDVDEGRRALNFSEWQRNQTHADDAPMEIMEKAMPPSSYLLLHSTAKLTNAEREQLAGSIQRMVALQIAPID